MELSKVATAFSVWLKNTIAPTLNSGIQTGAVCAVCAVIEAKPEVFASVLRGVPLLQQVGIITKNEMDVDLLAIALRGYFTGATQLTIPVCPGFTYSINQQDADKLIALLESAKNMQAVAEAKTSINYSATMPQAMPQTLPVQVQQ